MILQLVANVKKEEQQVIFSVSSPAVPLILRIMILFQQCQKNHQHETSFVHDLISEVIRAFIRRQVGKTISVIER